MTPPISAAPPASLRGGITPFLPARCRTLFVLAGALLFAAHGLRAANGTWTASAGGTWSNSSNWNSSVIPGGTNGTASADTATFNSAGTIAVATDANRNIENITFDTAAGAYTIGANTSNPLLLTNGGTIQITSTFASTTNAETVAAPLIIEGGNGSGYTLSNYLPGATSGGLRLTGTISGTATASGTTTLTLSGSNTSANNYLSGPVVDGAGGGSLALVKSGSGLWTLAATDTYGGGTTISAGTLQVGSNGAAGSISGNISVASGANLTWLTFGSTNQTYSGVISGAGSFKKSGASVATLTLSGSNTYTGSTNVAAGTLIVTGDFGNTAITVAGAGATLSLQNANAVNQNSVTVGSGAASPGVLSETVVNSLGNSTALTVFTGGTATLSVANNYTGGTTLRDGVLLIGDNGALGLGTLALGKSGDSNLSPTIGSMDSNAHSVSNALSIAGTGPTLTFGATGGGTGALTFSYTGAVSLGGTNRTFAVNNTTTFAGGFTSASGAITKTGAGTMILSGTSNYTGATTISAGALVVTGSLSGTVSPSVAANSGFEVDGLINLSSTASVTGTLSGDGSLGAVTVNANGVFAPGLTSTVSASGSMTANGNVVLTNSSSVFSIRLGVASASDHDQLNIVGSSTVSLNGATLQIAVSPDYARQANNFVYVLINGGASGTGTAGNVFAEGSSITASNGDEFTILYDSNATGTGIGNDVVLELSSVPEPETWGTFLGGAGLLIAMRRNRRTRKI